MNKKIKPAAKRAATPQSRKTSKSVARRMPPKASMHEAILRNNELLAELVEIERRKADAIDRMADAVDRIADAVAKKRGGYKGSKTPYMARQLEGFAKFTKEHPIVDGDSSRNAYSIANRYWDKHKEEFDKAIKLVGNARGYTSYKVLAQAHKDILKKTNLAS